jgi:uncharacterized membrane protein YgcG
MSILSTTFRALLAATTAFTIVTAMGCGTDAKGVDDCRDIEEARCTAAAACGTVSDVNQCQLFYRDQCLHGLAVSSPGSVTVNACVATIRAAGVCAGQGKDTAPSDCATAPSKATTASTTCEIVSNPEETAECAFLQPAADAGIAGSGGGGGASGSAGSAGTGGSGGSSSGAGGAAE